MNATDFLADFGVMTILLDIFLAFLSRKIRSLTDSGRLVFIVLGSAPI